MTATHVLPPAPPSTVTVSVVICTYTMRRWDDVVRAVESVRQQTLRPEEIILVVDHNDDLARHARAAFPAVRVIGNAQTRGLSGARNTGVRAARGDVVAFLDDDASAAPTWLESMVTHYDDPAVQGVGGSATAVWTGGPRPRWLPAEFDWVVGCTYVGQPTSPRPVRNLIGCNMSFRRGVFDLVGGFSSEIGRIGNRPLGGEETELCIRLNRAVPDAKLIYDPAINVDHRVSPDRREFRYFRDRCYSEGLSKAAVTRLVGQDHALASERSYVWGVLPRGFLLALLQALLLRPAAAGRAFAIVFGLLATSAGYVRGSLGIDRRRAPGGPGPALAVAVALGCSVALLGLAVTASRGNAYGLGLGIFFTAVMVPFVVGAPVLLRRDLTARTRLAVVTMIGAGPTLLYRLLDPLSPMGFDEQLHLRTLGDLLHGAPLASANPLLEASPHFPGLELLTVAVQRALGLPTMVAVAAVVIACRLVLTVAVYRLAAMITGDLRSASLAVLCYAASPQFYFFNSQYAYQTLALSLLVTGVLLLARAGRLDRHRRRTAVAAFACFAATAATHHLTSVIMLATLITWTVLATRRERAVVAVVTLATAAVTATQAVLSMALLRAYFEPMAAAAAEQAGALFSGGSHRTLFADPAGTSAPAWERLVLVGYAVLCTAVAVGTGVAILRYALRRRHRLLIVIGLLCLAYPLTFAGRFASFVAEIGDRATTFAFLPLAIGAGWLLRDRDRVTAPRRPHPAVLVALACLGVLGGLILGNGPDWGRLPGSYLVVADGRSLDAETQAAARWAGGHLAAGSSIVADRVPATVLSSVGRLWPEPGPRDGAEPASLYFSQTWGPEQTRTAEVLGLHYLYVDTRLASSLPHMAWYFYPGETPDRRQLTMAGLTKFDLVPGVAAVYRHGPVTIYDLSGLGITTRTHGWTGDRQSPAWLDVLAGLLIAALALWLAVAVRPRPLGRWARATVTALGGPGTAGVIMAALVLLTGASIAIGFRPGWPFSVALTLPIGTAVLLRLTPVLRLPSRPRAGAAAALALAVVLGAAGVGLALHSAWSADETQVSSILAGVARGGG